MTPSPEDVDEPVLFDVGVIALSHSQAPMRGTALAYVRQAVHGDLGTIVPYSAVYGAHHILCTVYGFATHEATHVLTNFLDARRIHWYTGPDGPESRAGLDVAGEHNIDGWDGYYAHLAEKTGATTIVAVDNDFERVAGLDTVIPLSEDERTQFATFF